MTFNKPFFFCKHNVVCIYGSGGHTVFASVSARVFVCVWLFEAATLEIHFDFNRITLILW